MERPSNSCKFTTQVCLHFRRKLYVIYCQNNKWNKISLCWWRIILHVSINEVFLLCFFSFRISFDHLPCYLEPTLFRELTREPTGSFSFLAYTLFLIQKMHIDKSIIKIILLFYLNFSCWSGLQASSHIFVFFDHSDFYFFFCRIHFYTSMVSSVTWNKKMHIRAGSGNGAYVTNSHPM